MYGVLAARYGSGDVLSFDIYASRSTSAVLVKESAKSRKATVASWMNLDSDVSPSAMNTSTNGVACAGSCSEKPWNGHRH